MQLMLLCDRCRGREARGVGKETVSLQPGRSRDTTVQEEPSQETEAEKVESPGRDLRGTAPRLAAREKQGKRHSEL